MRCFDCGDILALNTLCYSVPYVLYSTQLESKWENITKLINATICNNSEIVLTALDVATTLCNALRQQIQAIKHVIRVIKTTIWSTKKRR